MADIERSFLDAKERGELVAIAGALGIKPSPRAKKETVIDQIMKVTGADAATPAPVTEAKKPAGRKPKAENANEGKGDSGARNASVPDPSEAPVVVSEERNNDPAERPARNDRPNRSNGGQQRAERPERNGRSRPAAALFDPFADTADDSNTSSGYDPVEDEWAFAAAKPAGDSGNGGGELKTVATPADLRDDTASASAGAPGSEEGFGGGRRNRRDRFRDRAEGGAPREPREPREVGPQGDRPDRQDRGPRGDRPDRQDRGPRPDRPGGDQGNRQFGGGQQGFDKSFEGEGRNKRRRRGRDRDRQVTAGQDAVADRISETYTGELIEIDGFLDLADQGYGYIRAKGYLPSPGDVYVPVNKVKQLGLRRGDKVAGRHRPATAQEKFPAIVEVDTVNGHNVEVARLRPKFEDLTPLFPDVKLRLEEPGQSGNMVSRIIDLVAPIGKGQRGLIVSPPKAGKTTIMKQIAASIETNNPTVHLMVLLIDERPEEVTDMRRHVKGEVVASTFDKPSDEHTMVAELALERAKRLVEEGRDVIIILDGITRLARAYNLAAPATGRIMSGGIDTGALYPPKKFFGAARNIEEGGSLTILATALIETGSTMDTVIFEEFKGTGNMELRLDRRLAEKRIYPAINVNESSTRHEELLFDKVELETIWKLRRVLNGLAEDGTAAKALELLMDRIKTTRTNAEFLAEIAKAPGVH
jgi:transcription termination factor Rho